MNKWEHTLDNGDNQNRKTNKAKGLMKGHLIPLDERLSCNIIHIHNRRHTGTLLKIKFATTFYSIFCKNVPHLAIAREHHIVVTRYEHPSDIFTEHTVFVLYFKY